VIDRRAGRSYIDRSGVDRAFDALLPRDMRRLSRVHWTPVEIAARAVALLCTDRDTRVLDVGSGIGKLCTIGALSEMGTWTGVEQHESFVVHAERIARRLGADARTKFIHGDAFAVDWCDYDALYFYNPFERLFGTSSLHGMDIDGAIQAVRARERLSRLRRGTRVVTLHGFGAAIPSSYRLMYHEQVPSYGIDLVLWVQGTSPPHDRGVPRN
jgi:hypothetical protein